MKNRSGKEMICAFTYLATDLKSRVFNSQYHSMDNEVSTTLKNKITTIYIKYQLFPPVNHIENNA